MNQPLNPTWRLTYYTTFVVALMGMLGSLYFSEVLHLVPCLLCWYQRIFLYPLVFLIPVGILRNDRNLPWYLLPMTIMGTLIALYHTLLQYGVVAESSLTCSLGVSCAAKQTILFDWLTIPLMSFMAFALISVAMVWLLKKRSANVQ